MDRENSHKRIGILSEINLPTVFLSVVSGFVLGALTGVIKSHSGNLAMVILASTNVVITLGFIWIVILERKSGAVSISREKEGMEEILEKSKKVFEQLSLNSKLLFFGHPYRERIAHFSREKEKLAYFVVKNVLPKIVEDVLRKNNQIQKVNFILDAGTTITPIFKNLMKIGIQFTPPENSSFESKGFHFLTNNLAGIDLIQNLEDYEMGKFQEENFTIISGRPTRKYMSILGQKALNFLAQVRKEETNNKDTILNVGIVTANWFSAGDSHDKLKLSLLAAGEDHLRFKEEVIKHSDITIIVAPLGKILKIADGAPLEKAINEYKAKEAKSLQTAHSEDREIIYTPYTIPNEKKDSTYLITSFREGETVFKQYSDRLLEIKKMNNTENFKFWGEICLFDPSGTKAEIEREELPHDYVRKSKDVFYR